ncbi:MAG TPA: hypothetical protein P5110_03100 [Candidatus Omnitrophota bacterium]|nr:hypothetical protein [Candidatus Omnitrophota bacterium]HRZ14476.1 hypothetical protein [Candidatus Omnitrophota bacterium]
MADNPEGSMEKGSKRIGEILIEKGFITEAQLNDALLDQKVTDKFLGMILKEKGVITDKELMQALAEQFGIQLVDIKTYYIDMELASKFTTSLIMDHKCFPLKEDEYTLTMAIVNPLNAVAIAKIEEEASPRQVELVLVLESDLQEILQQYKQYSGQRIQRLLKRNKPAEGGPTA